MVPYERHVFVCENERPAENPRGCCAAKGGSEVRAALKKRVIEAGLRGRVRINKAGCLDRCEEGLTVVVYPEAVWYRRVTLADVDEIFGEHILGGRPVRRLRLDVETTDSAPD
jgi:(2Fe-2S) ferredoxin